MLPRVSAPPPSYAPRPNAPPPRPSAWRRHKPALEPPYTAAEPGVRAAWIIHGENDGTVDFTSGGIGTRDFWLDQNGCSTAAEPAAASPAGCVEYQECQADAPVAWCVHTQGHNWPTATGSGCSDGGVCFDAGAAIWAFFTRFEWLPTTSRSRAPAPCRQDSLVAVLPAVPVARRERNRHRETRSATSARALHPCRPRALAASTRRIARASAFRGGGLQVVKPLSIRRNRSSVSWGAVGPSRREIEAPRRPGLRSIGRGSAA